MIHETIIITLREDGAPHITPLGVREQDGLILLAPFRPSSTLDNLSRSGCATMNLTDDVRVFAGCLTGRRDWPTRATARIDGRVLDVALAHVELQVERFEDDPVRPRFYCREVIREMHAPFRGFNRAQAAVVEGAILISRLDRLPAEKIDREMEYLSIAVEKTAGSKEREAWGWIVGQVAEFRGCRRSSGEAE